MQNGENFKKISCAYKVGVDPDECSMATVFLPSDEFFKMNKENFDIIFIDGLHHSEQVNRDIENSLKILNSGGIIIMHDCLPTSEASQVVPRIQTHWNGDVWKSFVYFRRFPNLVMKTLNLDCGLGIIEKGEQSPLVVENPTYQEFRIHKQDWMNICELSNFVI